MSELNRAIESLKNGKMVILIDDEDRENEGDLVLAAEYVTPSAINFLAKHARGLICLSLEADRVEQLDLPMMTSKNNSTRQTAFTVSIEAKEGVTTGISASDRANTIKVATDSTKGQNDLVSPGHVFPLKAERGGVLVRAGHTEGSLDLCKVAGLKPAAVICEIMNDDGTMARIDHLKEFSKKHGDIPIVTIQELISYRMARETLIQEIAKTRFPTRFGNFEMRAFRSLIDGTENIALIKHPLSESSLVRVHSECLTGDALGSLRCDCGGQLQSALQQISQNGSGVLVYMRRHEGRGIGLGNKIKAYELQDQGLDTVDANRHLGFKMDLRNYGMGAQILRHLGIRKIRLLTNNPKKVVGLAGYGLEIIDKIPIQVHPTSHNLSYLRTKRDKMDHDLGELDVSQSQE